MSLSIAEAPNGASGVIFWAANSTVLERPRLFCEHLGGFAGKFESFENFPEGSYYE